MKYSNKIMIATICIFSCNAQESGLVESVQPQIETAAQSVANSAAKAKDAVSNMWHDLENMWENMEDVFEKLHNKFEKEMEKAQEVGKNTWDIFKTSNVNNLQVSIDKKSKNYIITISGIPADQAKDFQANVSYDKQDVATQATISNDTQNIDIQYSPKHKYIQVRANQEVRIQKDTKKNGMVESVSVSTKSSGRNVQEDIQLDALNIDYITSDEQLVITIPMVIPDVKTKSINVNIK